MPRLVYASQLSTDCFVDACEECRDPDCMCICHETVEPVDEAPDDVTWGVYERRAERRADV